MMGIFTEFTLSLSFSLPLVSRFTLSRLSWLSLDLGDINAIFSQVHKNQSLNPLGADIEDYSMKKR